MNLSTHTPRSFPHTLRELRCEWSAVVARYGHQAAEEALAKARLLPGSPVSLGLGVKLATLPAPYVTIMALETLNQAFGCTLGWKTEEEFDDMMERDASFVL